MVVVMVVLMVRDRGGEVNDRLVSGLIRIMTISLIGDYLNSRGVQIKQQYPTTPK